MERALTAVRPDAYTSPMDALSFNLCFDTTSMAHRDAVRGERHPTHLCAVNH